MTKFVNVSRFRPDESVFSLKSTAYVNNVIPTIDGFGPLKSLSVISNALGADCKGGVWVRLSSGGYKIYVGTTTDLFLFNQDKTYTNVSKTAGGYNVPSGDHWSFEVFGSKLIAVNINTVPQVLDIDAGGSFADLAGSPPNARYVWSANNHLCLGNLSSLPRRVQYSAYNNIEGWTIGRDGADIQDFDSGASIHGGIGDEQGAFVLQRDRVSRLIFNPNARRSFDRVSIDSEKGAVAPRSIVAIGQNDFMFLAESGYYRWKGEMLPVGAEKVNRWFFKRVHNDHVNQVQGALDPFNKMVWFLYTNTSNVREMLGFDWQLKEWTRSDANPKCLASLASPRYGVEDLTQVSSSLDQLPYSLDSYVWAGGRPRFGAWDADDKLAFFEGSNMEAIIDSPCVKHDPQYKTYVNGFRIVTDAPIANVTAFAGGADLEGDAIVLGSELTPSAVTGEVPAIISGRIHQYRSKIAAGTVWSRCHGFVMSDVQMDGDL